MMRENVENLMRALVVSALCLMTSGCYFYGAPYPGYSDNPTYPNGYIPSYPPGTGPVIQPVTPITPVNPQPYRPNGYIPHHRPIPPVAPVTPSPQPYRPNGYIPHQHPVPPVAPVTPTPSHGNVTPNASGLTPDHKDDKNKDKITA